jgi:hypothetical protein
MLGPLRQQRRDEPKGTLENSERHAARAATPFVFPLFPLFPFEFRAARRVSPRFEARR